MGNRVASIRVYRDRLLAPLAEAEALMQKYPAARKWRDVSEEDLQTVGRLLAIDFDLNLDRLPTELNSIKARIAAFVEWDARLGYPDTEENRQA